MSEDQLGTWAANDYEPSADEFREWIEFWREVMIEPGHGFIEMLPSMERYIWNLEGIFWGHRELLEGGRVRLEWLRPE